MRIVSAGHIALAERVRAAGGGIGALFSRIRTRYAPARDARTRDRERQAVLGGT